MSDQDDQNPYTSEKARWQAEQEILDHIQDKEKRAAERRQARKAKSALRKLERLQKELTDLGDTTDWEQEFTSSVTERLETFGSAFADPSKGGYGEALSFAQKSVMANMRRKVKRLKDKARAHTGDGDDHYTENVSRPKYEPRKGGFKSKKTPKFTPRVRQLDEDFDDAAPTPKTATFKPATPEVPAPPPKPTSKRPFLRLVKNDDD